MEALSMCDPASGSLSTSLRPPHLCASRAEQLAARSQALVSRIPQALGAFVVRSACWGSRPLRRRSGRVSQSTGRRFQSVVGASRRLNSQQLSAAMEGSARSARMARQTYSAKEITGPSRLARSEAVQGVTPNPSIERTRPGKPGRASHVKRWASRKE
jgi:hypothetical protein